MHVSNLRSEVNFLLFGAFNSHHLSANGAWNSGHVITGGGAVYLWDIMTHKDELLSDVDPRSFSRHYQALFLLTL